MQSFALLRRLDAAPGHSDNPMKEDVDFLVIGGGSGGIAAARRAAEYGARDSAIGLWGLGKRARERSLELYGSEKREALESGVRLCTQALAKRSVLIIKS